MATVANSWCSFAAAKPGNDAYGWTHLDIVVPVIYILTDTYDTTNKKQHASLSMSTSGDQVMRGNSSLRDKLNNKQP